MTDTLHTRIASVQQAHHLRMDPNHPAWGYCRCGLNVGFQDRADEPVPEFEWWVIHARHVADAVIRELERGLRCEDCEKEWLEDESRWIRE